MKPSTRALFALTGESGDFYLPHGRMGRLEFTHVHMRNLNQCIGGTCLSKKQKDRLAYYKKKKFRGGERCGYKKCRNTCACRRPYVYAPGGLKFT